VDHVIVNGEEHHVRVSGNAAKPGGVEGIVITEKWVFNGGEVIENVFVV
jgi:hypothetical protein